MTALSALLQEGISYHQAGDLDSAEACYRQASELAPHSEQVKFLLAELAFHRGNYKEAELLVRTVLASSPCHNNALLRLGQILLALGSPLEAVATFQLLSRFAPTWPTAWEYLGKACQLSDLLEDAEEAYCRFVELDPKNDISWIHLADLYLDCHHPEQAAAILEQALSLFPVHPELTRRLGDAYRLAGNTEAARNTYRSVVHSQRNGALAITEAITLPPFYHSCDHIQESRHAMEVRLAELEEEKFPPCSDPVAAGGKNNFYSVYQGFDDRPVQEQLARLWRRIYCPSWQSPLPRPAGRHRVKVGFVSAHFRRHTIGDLFSGLIAGLPKEDFEVVVFHLGEQKDDVTDWLASRVESFHMPRSSDLSLIADSIGAEACDILIYPDIGMEPLTYFLAFNRLASVQAVSWGHPVTTGLDTIDYFISGDLQEPIDGQGYYTEKLLRLPAIPCYLPWAESPPEDQREILRRKLGVPSGGRLYGIVQSLFKMHPSFDPVIAELLAATPKNRFVLVADRKNQLAPALVKRLAPRLGDLREALHILPHQGFEDYRRLLSALDACIDTHPFGGGKTTFDSAIIGTPVACINGIRLAGKTAQAVRQQFGLDWPLATAPGNMVAAIEKSSLKRQRLEREVIEETNQQAILAWANAIQTIANRRP